MNGASGAATPEPPRGTVVFLFTDIEGSTRRWEQDPDDARVVLGRHNALLAAACEAHGGYVFKTVGDAFCVAFEGGPAALEAALAAQHGLLGETWGDGAPLRVRMGLHAGEADLIESDYFGRPLNRVARLLSAAHGGQVLLSAAVYELCLEESPAGVSYRDLGLRRLKDLQSPLHIWQALRADLPQSFPALRTLDDRPHNLPVQPTPLLGRETQLAEARTLLRSGTRLLTLTGPGGAGKTRLGLAIGADLLDEAEDGAFFVSLAGVTNPDEVPAAVATALGLREGAGAPAEQVAEHLSRRQHLLLLDNFEQVLEAAPVVAGWLEQAPRLRIVVTSRAPLLLRGEREMPVPPLALPPAGPPALAARLSQYAAVALFIQRAAAVKPDFEVTNENAPAVAELCTRLDGLPLAIELAASRVRLFSPSGILRRLEQSLDFLISANRALPVRHRTLRAAIAWSYELLSPTDQSLLRRLAAFAGGFTLGAAEEAFGALPGAGDIVTGLTTLTEQSLIRATPDSERFEMLVTLREFALGELAASGEEAAVRDAHAVWMRRLLEQAAPYWDTADAPEWLQRLEPDWENFRAALQHLAKRDPAVALDLAGKTWFAGFRTGRLRESLDRLLMLLAQPENAAPSASRGLALHAAATFSWATGAVAMAAQLFDQALAIRRQIGDPAPLAATLNNRASFAREQGDYDTATTLYTEALALRRIVGQPALIATSLANLSLLATDRGELAVARRHGAEALALFRSLGDERNVGTILGNLGRTAMYGGQVEEAARYFAEALAVQQRVGDPRAIAVARLQCAAADCVRGELDAARAHAEESLARGHETDDAWLEAYALGTLGWVAERSGDWVRARNLLQDSLRRRVTLGDASGQGELLQHLVVTFAALGDAPRAAQLLGAERAIQRQVGYHRLAMDPAAEKDPERQLAAVLGPEALAREISVGEKLTLAQAAAVALR